MGGAPVPPAVPASLGDREMSQPRSPVAWVGASAMRGTQFMGRMVLFLGVGLGWIFLPPAKLRRSIQQVYDIGVQSLFVVFITAAFTGMVLGLQGYYTLSKFGSETLLGSAVALSLIRELGPVLTALMVTGRAGSSMAAEIGIMRISEQIDALDTMAIDPMKFLVAPRLAGSIVAVPLLTAFFDVVGIYGGYIIGVKLLGVNPGAYFGEMRSSVEMVDIIGGLIKSLCFGCIIAWVCCYMGYFAERGAAGVSRATTTAVVLSSALIFMWDYLLTSVLL